MKARRATMADYRQIKANLAGRMANEYIAAGYTPESAMQMLKTFIPMDQADAITTDGGSLLAILFHFVEDGVIQTGFAAREEFFSGLSLRIAKKHLMHLQQRYGGLPLQSNSYPQAARTEEWFKRIGFLVYERHPDRIVFHLEPPLKS